MASLGQMPHNLAILLSLITMSSSTSCVEQSQCLEATRNVQEGGLIEICMIYNTALSPSCGVLQDPTFNVPVCQIVKCEGSAQFSLSDGTMCENTVDFKIPMISNINDISCTSGPQGDCIWTIPSESCSIIEKQNTANIANMIIQPLIVSPDFLSMPSNIVSRYPFRGPQALNFSAAKAYCKAQGTTLVSVKSDIEFQLMRQICWTQNYQALECWIGLFLDTRKNRWRWLDGTCTTYGFVKGVPTTGIRPWNVGEPNGTDSSEECVEITPRNLSNAFFWGDITCDVLRYPLCAGIDSKKNKRYSAQDEPQMELTNDFENDDGWRISNGIMIYIGFIALTVFTGLSVWLCCYIIVSRGKKKADINRLDSVSLDENYGRNDL